MATYDPIIVKGMQIIIVVLLAGCSTPEPKTITIGAIEMQTIPNLTAQNICGFYESKGFNTQYTGGTDNHEWTSLLTLGTSDRVVITYGKTPSEIVSIDSYFKNYSPEDRRDSAFLFLSQAALLPYSNYKPLVAEQWIKSHMQTGGDTTIGFVSFKLMVVGESAGTLKMSVGMWR